MEIRELSIDEVEEALLLIKEVFLATEAKECTPGGVSVFLDSLKVSDFIAMIREEQYILLGVFDEEDRFAGVLGARGGFLALLFVSLGCMGRGYGKRLYRFYEDRLLSGEVAYSKISTNSSLGAVSFYEKLDFYSTGDQEQIHGIPFVSMEKMLSREDGYTISKT
ncbi:GNAT family N-acetyltransferase [Proteiniclasticum sp. C24MP]|uniref:GNAT family N-acetyltransferase n=1 Tax=Proteiniclasticum sp. C24MP TaxID=3374101 RepID=UPI00375472F1